MKMLNITHQQGKAHQNDVRRHLTLVRMAKIKNTRNKCWQGCEKKESSCTLGGNANWCSHSGKEYGVPQKVKNRTTL